MEGSHGRPDGSGNECLGFQFFGIAAAIRLTKMGDIAGAIIIHNLGFLLNLFL